MKNNYFLKFLKRGFSQSLKYLKNLKMIPLGQITKRPTNYFKRKTILHSKKNMENFEPKKWMEMHSH
jgi:hypothetical protein